MRVKKISDKQFIFDVVKKGFEIAGAPINWSSWDELVEYSKEHKQWYTEAVFTTVKQYNQWKSYFYEHFYDWKPKRYSKKSIQREFSWFSLMYGPKFEFDISEIKYD